MKKRVVCVLMCLGFLAGCNSVSIEAPKDLSHYESQCAQENPGYGWAEMKGCGLARYRTARGERVTRVDIENLCVEAADRSGYGSSALKSTFIESCVEAVDF